jgi:hypothetical protein
MMTVLCLYDAVTLRHFGAIARLDVLEARCRYLDPPHWTQAVFDEISDAANSPGCRDILAAGWLSSPLAPQPEDQRKILLIQIGLNDGRRPPVAHAGEAEGIYFAEKLGGRFVLISVAGGRLGRQDDLGHRNTPAACGWGMAGTGRICRGIPG